MIKNGKFDFESQRVGLDSVSSRNRDSENKSILLLGAEMLALLNEDVHLILGDVNFYLVKFSAFFLTLSILCFTFSSFNLHNIKSLFWLMESPKSSGNIFEDIKISEGIEKKLKRFTVLGQWGNRFWMIGITLALIAGVYFLVMVG